MIGRNDIAAAAGRIAAMCGIRLSFGSAGSELGLRFPVCLKLELLQHAGSFKPRGAFNRLLLSAGLPRRRR